MSYQMVLGLVRAFVVSELLDSADRNWPDDKSLFISSVLGIDEFNDLTLFLDERFGVQIPASMYGQHVFDTLSTISAVVADMIDP